MEIKVRIQVMSDSIPSDHAQVQIGYQQESAAAAFELLSGIPQRASPESSRP